MLRAAITVLLASLLLTACSLPTRLPAPTGDADIALMAREDAESMIRNLDYQGATEMLALAYQQTPTDLSLALRYGELLEATRQPRQAAAIYREVLRGIPAGDSEEIRELRYRLALVSLYHLDNPAEAKQQLQLLNRASHQALDLQACLILQDGTPDAAIMQLELAQRLARSDDRKATAYYHLALAYLQKQRPDEALKNLYQAINHASHLGLVADIEDLWQRHYPSR